MTYLLKVCVLVLLVAGGHSVLAQTVVDVDVEMRKAESRLAEAARQVAELSSRRLQNLPVNTWSTRIDQAAVLGISIGSLDDGEGPVEGAEVYAVSPGGAAHDAGLRAGDVLTAVNGETLGADTRGAANRKLLDFMSGVREGDVVDVEYLRAGKSANVEVSPRPLSPQVFSFSGPATGLHFGSSAMPLEALNETIAVFEEPGWGDMEMVRLTEDLGRYFGTSEGMLVVRAPQDQAFQLQDGDVILDIDGRKPTSVMHATRILHSYEHGESLELRIMRDKRRETLEIEVPERSSSPQSMLLPEAGVRIAPSATRRARVVRRSSPPDDRI